MHLRGLTVTVNTKKCTLPEYGTQRFGNNASAFVLSRIDSPFKVIIRAPVPLPQHHWSEHSSGVGDAGSAGSIGPTESISSVLVQRRTTLVNQSDDDVCKPSKKRSRLNNVEGDETGRVLPEQTAKGVTGLGATNVMEGLQYTGASSDVSTLSLAQSAPEDVEHSVPDNGKKHDRIKRSRRVKQRGHVKHDAPFPDFDLRADIYVDGQVEPDQTIIIDLHNALTAKRRPRIELIEVSHGRVRLDPGSGTAFHENWHFHEVPDVSMIDKLLLDRAESARPSYPTHPPNGDDLAQVFKAAASVNGQPIAAGGQVLSTADSPQLGHIRVVFERIHCSKSFNEDIVDKTLIPAAKISDAPGVKLSLAPGYGPPKQAKMEYVTRDVQHFHEPPFAVFNFYYRTGPELRRLKFDVPRHLRKRPLEREIYDTHVRKLDITKPLEKKRRRSPSPEGDEDKLDVARAAQHTAPAGLWAAREQNASVYASDEEDDKPDIDLTAQRTAPAGLWKSHEQMTAMYTSDEDD